MCMVWHIINVESFAANTKNNYDLNQWLGLENTLSANILIKKHSVAIVIPIENLICQF